MKGPISEFRGIYSFLSNFYLTPVTFEGKEYRSSEHAYMAAKTTDPALRNMIAMAPTPGEAKKVGLQVRLRRDWEEIKFDVMLTVLRSKFEREELAALLLSTGDRHLSEGNWWGDTIWGVCNKTGQGANNLGRLLMVVRDELKAAGKEAGRAPKIDRANPDIRVVNRHQTDEGEYVGHGTPLGNIFRIDEGKGETREVVIAKFAKWLDEKLAARDPKVVGEMNRLLGIYREFGQLSIKCSCAPKACHGDVIADKIRQKVTRK